MRETFFTELYEIAKKDKNVILITGDLGYGLFDKFRKDLSGQFINAGIAEQNMISIATGMALEGKKVFVYSIANFPTFRCLEQIRNDVAYHKANVKIISAGVGFDYGTLGFSHHATEDIAIIRAIPEISIISPCDLFEAKIAAEYSYKNNGPFYIRLGKGKNGNMEIKRNNFDIKKAFEIRKGKKIAMFTTGSIINEVIKATENLQKQSIDVAIYNFAMIKPIDKEFILDSMEKFDIIFTLEEHRICGGFGSAVCEVAAEKSKKARIIKIGLKDDFTFVSGSPDYLRHINEIDSKGIENIILEYTGRKGK